MSYPVSASVTATTNAAGGAVAYIPVLRGRLVALQYTKVNFADGVGFTVTAESSAAPIVTTTNTNASALWYPTAATHDANGAATATLTAIPIVNDRIKIVVASGGNATTGTFTATVC